tara:strand:+ start:90 stop:272 length:183 start_codon:yes stop_codon:yes gene_type:complete
MKKGDLVKHAFAHPRQKLFGIILSKVSFDRMTVNRDNAYKVLWRDGTIVTAWDCDLARLK